jgi:hypothetical protein
MCTRNTISVAVLNSTVKLVIESIIETKASTILQFLQGLSGSLHVTFEEGTWAAWLYDLLKPHVTRLVVCNPRRNALLKEGSKSDRITSPGSSGHGVIFIGYLQSCCEKGSPQSAYIVVWSIQERP